MHWAKTRELRGAAHAVRQDLGIFWSAAERMLHEPLLNAARSRIHQSTWEVGFAEGRSLTLEEAVDYALSHEEPALPASPTREQPTAGTSTGELSRREVEVATLVAHGFTNRQIARELSISEHTVATHVSRIHHHTDVHSL